MNRSIRPRRLLLLAIPIILVASVVAAEAARDDSERPFAARPKAQGVDETLASRFKVFRTKPPADATEEITPAFGPAGANPNLARQVGPAGAGLLAVPGEGQVCLARRGATDCIPIALATAGKLVSIDYCGPQVPDGKIRIAGLVPDGIDSIAIDLKDGKRTTADVSENGYQVDVTAIPRTVGWDTVGGEMKIPTPGGGFTAADLKNCVT